MDSDHSDVIRLAFYREYFRGRCRADRKYARICSKRSSGRPGASGVPGAGSDSGSISHENGVELKPGRGETPPGATRAGEKGPKGNPGHLKGSQENDENQGVMREEAAVVKWQKQVRGQVQQSSKFSWCIRVSRGTESTGNAIVKKRIYQIGCLQAGGLGEPVAAQSRRPKAQSKRDQRGYPSPRWEASGESMAESAESALEE